MNQLWIPISERELPDLSNPLDMTVVYQREINALDDPMQKYDLAKDAIAQLSEHFQTENEMFENVSLATYEALIESAYVEQEVASLVSMVGLIGQIKGISYFGVAHNNFGLTLDMEAEYLFPLQTPDEGDMIMLPARIPVRALQYVRFAS